MCRDWDMLQGQGDVMGVKGKEENRPHPCHRYLAVLLQQDGSAIIDLKLPMVS